MPEPGAYVQSLRNRGFTVTLARNFQSFTVEPAAKITDSLRKRIREHRDYLLNDLQLEQMNKRGYLLVDSAMLGERIAIGPGPYPAGVVGYTMDELTYLSVCDPEHIARIHEIKKQIPGTVIDDYPTLDDAAHGAGGVRG